jgi:hypothetical protein
MTLPSPSLGKFHPPRYPNTAEKKSQKGIIEDGTPASPKSRPVLLDDDVSIFELES